MHNMTGKNRVFHVTQVHILFMFSLSNFLTSVNLQSEKVKEASMFLAKELNNLASPIIQTQIFIYGVRLVPDRTQRRNGAVLRGRDVLIGK